MKKGKGKKSVVSGKEGNKKPKMVSRGNNGRIKKKHLSGPDKFSDVVVLEI